MTPILTTITPVWKREEMLRIWLKSMRGASVPYVHHLVYFVGEAVPDWFREGSASSPITAIACDEKPGASIAHYHNLGAQRAETEWIMKYDVDCVANVRFFQELVYTLQSAKPCEWFNVGMLFVSRHTSERFLTLESVPLHTINYLKIILEMRRHSAKPYALPEATNFVCRRNEYLALGGADGRFQQYGWEDYQQTYMLERHERGCDPLPGLIDLSNVTKRCRDEITRPKARALFDRNKWLCLFHRWHPPSPDKSYKNPAQLQLNREILFDYITKRR